MAMSAGYALEAPQLSFYLKWSVPGQGFILLEGSVLFHIVYLGFVCVCLVVIVVGGGGWGVIFIYLFIFMQKSHFSIEKL